MSLNIKSSKNIINNETINKKPQHIAVIMDGNRRWAKQKKIPINFGHKKGADNVENICNWCINNNIKYLSLYCLSIENLNRTEEELFFLFKYIEDYLCESELQKYISKGISINIIGDFSLLPNNIQSTIKNANNKMDDYFNTNKSDVKLKVQLCISYSGRNEILNAVKNIVLDFKNNKKKDFDIDKIDEKYFESFLQSRDFPDVDLLIRTSGEYRISNFLLWKISYTEIYFCEKYWPDFNEEDFILALYFFQNRIRRYGR